MTERIRKAWNRFFARKPAFSWEQERAEVVLRALSRNPWACEALVKELGIEIDPGESAADYLAQSAHVAATDLQDEKLRRDMEYNKRRRLAHD